MKYAVPAALLMALAATTVSQAAPQSKASGRKCFQASEVSGWREGENRTFNLRTQRGDVYTGNLIGICPDIDWSNQIGIKTRTTSFVCEGDDATIIVLNSTLGRQSCDVNRIRKLSPEEIDKLEKRFRP